MEQAAGKSFERSHRQRVVHLVVLADGRARSDVHALPGDALEPAEAWRNAKPLGDLEPGSLELRAGRAALLTAQAALTA